MFNLRAVARALGLNQPVKVPFIRNGVQPTVNVGVLPLGATRVLVTGATAVSAVGNAAINFAIPAAFIKDKLCKVAYASLFGKDDDQAFTICGAVFGSDQVGVAGGIGMNGSGYCYTLNLPFPLYFVVDSSTYVYGAVHVNAFTTAGVMQGSIVLIHPDYWDLV